MEGVVFGIPGHSLRTSVGTSGPGSWDLFFREHLTWANTAGHTCLYTARQLTAHVLNLDADSTPPKSSDPRQSPDVLVSHSVSTWTA